MDKKVYIVFIHSAYDTFEGSWNGDTSIDSVWTDEDGAKIRLDILSNEFIEKMWYEEEAIPGKDYKEEWSRDKRSIKYEPDPYSETTIYIEEYIIRSGWNEDYKDLPAYFIIPT